jgi:hypothetical protein
MQDVRGFSAGDREFVRALWDDARTARLSELYYGARLDRLTKLNLISELLVAIGTSGSGISGWAVWHYGYGEPVWALVTGLAAVIAIARPLVGFERRVKDASQLQQLYRTVLGNLENLAFDIQQAGALLPEHRQRYQRAREELRLARDADDPAQNERKIKPLERRVIQEMPAHALWLPLSDPKPA